MRAAGGVDAGTERGRVTATAAALVAAAACVAGAVRGGTSGQLAAVVALAFLTVAIGHRRIFAWRYLMATMILVILLIPIRRYEIPGSLPFKLEPYRLLLALLAAGWLCSLLVDRRTRLRSSFLDLQIVLVPIVAMLSICANTSRLTDALVSEQVWKTVMFLFSFVIFYFVITSVVRGLDDVDFLLKVLVGGGAVVAISAVIEARTQLNVFNHLQSAIPALRFVGTDAGDLAREGKMRVLASSQHPIALSAALIMLLPIALYLGQTTRRRLWWAAAGVLLMAALATLSRTGVMMLLAVVLVFVWLRPATMKRLLPLVLPLAVAVHFVLPGTLGSFNELFFPEGGLVAEQAEGQVGSSRGASFRPGLKIVNRQPLLGQGYGTRIVGSEDANSFIVDDQWLGTAMETGLVGLGAWLWLFVRAIRRFGRAARLDRGRRGLLLTSLAASTAAFAVGMATYDAFSFIQVTFLLFALLGLGAVAVRAVDTARRPT
jgi:polysaccharide biosynthesis protein PslJ